MSLTRLIARWQKDQLTAPNMPVWQTTPGRLADMLPIPADFPAVLAEALNKGGITKLYRHQVEAWNLARAGENLVIATGTASGKTLGYNLPVIATISDNPNARALYIFPTKALTQDQLSTLADLNDKLPGNSIRSAIYDGDTPKSQRVPIRKNANIIFTNPDMVHTGILPHHTNWMEFFQNLRYIVIDEMHTYRGVFGSHVANVLRRLKRIANYYGASPQFILTSATIGNPQELAEKLIEAPVKIVNKDGSSRGPRHFIIYNPPVIDEATGLRKSSLLESVRLAQDLLDEGIQTVMFSRSRRSVEILLRYLQEGGSGNGNSGAKKGEPGKSPHRADEALRGYRSGYLPSQRREIEKGLREGSVRVVVATNALELGIDIGGLGAAVLVGYPGTIASTWQQAGRAGRGEEAALAVLVTSASPLDQFLAHHPDYLFGRSPEQALINPDHLLILLNHLRCAMFELPFKKGERFGSLAAETVQEYLDFLVNEQQAHLSQEKYFWMADTYPAAGISLRSASPDNVVLQVHDGSSLWVLGEVDMASVPWMIHPHAVYLHEGQQYYVEDLNFSTELATLIPVALDYFTEPQRQTEIQILTTTANGQVAGCQKGWGEIQVTLKVAGFKKLRWFTRENLGMEPLDLPPTEFQTTGYWLAVSDETVRCLSEEGLWTNAPNDYGPEWPKLREKVRARDGYRCQICGRPEIGKQHDVHHKIPFRTFRDEHGRILREQANRMENLVTLCPECHHQAEQNVRVRSGLAGLGSVLGQLAPLFLMCDPGDLGLHTDPANATLGSPGVVIYDDVPAGIGFSQKLYELHNELMKRALELVQECECEDGCPSCVGPAGENGVGGKTETLAILKELTKK
jgi:DEAD/DEAH box helicase domain-containing protein